MEKLKVGMLLFPNVTIQDFIGPYEVFHRAPFFEICIVSAGTAPISAEGGLTLQPAYSFADCPPLDILFVPGGNGIDALLEDRAYIEFLQQQGARAQYITSVCTGSLVLAAAGLLQGYKATTHWRSLDLLRRFGVDVVEERVVKDRNRITGGGVTAGIDFGLALTAVIGGEEVAKTIQLMLEYAPAPPFNCGSPATADKPVLQKALELSQLLFEKREKILERVIGAKA
jgi:cyclohexyl-isocyanide hydratase